MATSANILHVTSLFFGLTAVFAVALYCLLKFGLGIPNFSVTPVFGG